MPNEFRISYHRAIREGWACITAHPGLEKTGVDWLHLSFELQPGTKHHYKNFTNKTLEEICQTPYMKVQDSNTLVSIISSHLGALKTRPIAISLVLRANGDGSTDRPTDR